MQHDRLLGVLCDQCEAPCHNNDIGTAGLKLSSTPYMPPHNLVMVLVKCFPSETVGILKGEMVNVKTCQNELCFVCVLKINYWTLLVWMTTCGVLFFFGLTFISDKVTTQLMEDSYISLS